MNKRLSYRQQARRVAPRNLVWQPEHSFCGAMLTQCLLDGLLTNRRTYRSAAKFWMEQASEQPGGFVWCCRGVLLDPVAVHEAILERWRIGLPDGKQYRRQNYMRSAPPPGVTDPLL